MSSAFRLAAVAADGGFGRFRQPSCGVAAHHQGIFVGGILCAHERKHLLESLFRGRREVFRPAFHEFRCLQVTFQLVHPWWLSIVDEEEQAVVFGDVGHSLCYLRAVVEVVSAVAEGVLHTHIYHYHAPELFLWRCGRFVLFGAGGECDERQACCQPAECM